MEFFTLNRKFLKQDSIDKFVSGIWTERYYGDGEVQLIVPATTEMLQKLPIGIFLGLEGSKEVMILESAEIESGAMKLSGISLLQWFNNRFIRSSMLHEDRYWVTDPWPPGLIMWVLWYWAGGGSYMDGYWPMGIPNPERLVIPHLSAKGYDESDPPVSLAIPFGPVYDAMKSIATTYNIGMTLTLEWANDTAYSLQFLAYKGIDRTSRQSTYPIIRFSPDLENFTNIKELQSIKDSKTVVYSFAPANPDDMATTPGIADSSAGATGFDLRAAITFEEDITTDMTDADPALLLQILNSRASSALTSAYPIRTVDGEIVPQHQFQYGKDYFLGDIIEVQGNSGAIQFSRVTEYIRSHDQAGEKAYPTVAMLE
jgi:hypothetical protein